MIKKHSKLSKLHGSNKLFSGQIHFRLTGQNTAVSVKSCGREGSFLGSKPCFDPSDIFVESPYPYEQWETNQNIKISKFKFVMASYILIIMVKKIIQETVLKRKKLKYHEKK